MTNKPDAPFHDAFDGDYFDTLAKIIEVLDAAGYHDEEFCDGPEGLVAAIKGLIKRHDDIQSEYAKRAMTWDVPTWNGAPSRLVIAFEYDEDTELDTYCWRVGWGGGVCAEGRSDSNKEALTEALKHLPKTFGYTPWGRNWRAE